MKKDIRRFSFGQPPFRTYPHAHKAAPAVAQACMDALLTGTLALSNQSGLGVTGADGEAMAVEWPFGYTARNQLGTTVLVDETGQGRREGRRRDQRRWRVRQPVLACLRPGHCDQGGELPGADTRLDDLQRFIAVGAVAIGWYPPPSPNG